MSKNIYIKLDGRYTGYPHWKFCVPRPQRPRVLTIYESMQVFHSWREWAWDTWGPSKELANWLEDLEKNTQRIPGQKSYLGVSHNDHWSWVNDSFSTRIYLRDDAELSLFLLRWA